MNQETWVTRFKAVHLDMIELRDTDRVAVDAIPHYRAAAEVYEQNGGAYTLMCDQGIVAIAGVAPIMPGVGSAWMLGSALVYSYPKALYKATRAFLRAIEEDWNLHRVQASTADNDQVAEKWLQHLGFEEEGIMRRYGPDGSDHKLYARIMQ